jgi:hypothetical protein
MFFVREAVRGASETVQESQVRRLFVGPEGAETFS